MLFVSFSASLTGIGAHDSFSQDALEEVIQLMDDYYLTKEDWEAIVEMGVGEGYENDATLKKIAPAVKSAFTRMYVLVPLVRCSSLTFFRVGTTRRITLFRSARPTEERSLRRWREDRRRIKRTSCSCVPSRFPFLVLDSFGVRFAGL